MILIAGGGTDPNLNGLCSVARAQGVAFQPLLFGERCPVISWDLGHDEFRVGSRRLRPSAVFLRHDVFSSLADPRPHIERAALAWYTLLEGWTTSHPECRTLNANAHARINKPLALRVAESVGLMVPRTIVNNDIERTAEAGRRYSLVVKPVAGGDYCYPLEKVLSSEQARWWRTTPTIVQERLVAPEVRVYRVGDTLLPFQLNAPTLDYRMTTHCEVNPLDPSTISREVTVGLKRLTDHFGLDFAAADFKTCPRTQELLFLEVNTQPMFAAFDAVSDGAVSRAILRFLNTI